MATDNAATDNGKNNSCRSNSMGLKYQKFRNAQPARTIRKESDEGNIEYKFKINDWISKERKDILTSQMMFRLHQGDGIAVYNIGYHDDGTPLGLGYHRLFKTLEMLFEMIEEMVIEVKSVKIMKGTKGYCANILICKKVNTDLLPPGVEDFHDDW